MPTARPDIEIDWLSPDSEFRDILLAEHEGVMRWFATEPLFDDLTPPRAQWMKEGF